MHHSSRGRSCRCDVQTIGKLIPAQFRFAEPTRRDRAWSMSRTAHIRSVDLRDLRVGPAQGIYLATQGRKIRAIQTLSDAFS